MNSPIFLIAAHQKTQRPNLAAPAINLLNNRFNNSFFEKVSVEKYFSEIDGVRHPKNPFMINYIDNKCLGQYRDLKLIYKEYVGDSYRLS